MDSCTMDGKWCKQECGWRDLVDSCTRDAQWSQQECGLSARLDFPPGEWAARVFRCQTPSSSPFVETNETEKNTHDGDSGSFSVRAAPILNTS